METRNKKQTTNLGTLTQKVDLQENNQPKTMNNRLV